MNYDDLQAIARHALTTVGGVLVSDGLITSGQLQDAIGALMVLGGIGWSLWQKAQQRKQLAAAKAGQ